MQYRWPDAANSEPLAKRPGHKTSSTKRECITRQTKERILSISYQFCGKKFIALPSCIWPTMMRRSWRLYKIKTPNRQTRRKSKFSPNVNQKIPSMGSSANYFMHQGGNDTTMLQLIAIKHLSVFTNFYRKTIRIKTERVEVLNWFQQEIILHKERGNWRTAHKQKQKPRNKGNEQT